MGDEGRPGLVQQQTLANLDAADGVQDDQRVVRSRVQAGCVTREKNPFFRRQIKHVNLVGTTERKNCGTSAEVLAGLLQPGSPTATFSLNSAVEQKKVTIRTGARFADSTGQLPNKASLTWIALMHLAPFVSDTVSSYSHDPC